MPYRWVEPEVACEHEGKKIYYAYKGEHASQHWFTTDPSQDDLEGWYEGTDYQFDIRDLAQYIPDNLETTEERLRYVIKHRLVEWPED